MFGLTARDRFPPGSCQKLGALVLYKVPKKVHVMPRSGKGHSVPLRSPVTHRPGDEFTWGGCHAACGTQVRRRRPSEAAIDLCQQQVGGLYPLIPGPGSSPAAAAALPSVMARSAGPSQRRLPRRAGPRRTTNWPHLLPTARGALTSPDDLPDPEMCGGRWPPEAGRFGPFLLPYPRPTVDDP